MSEELRSHEEEIEAKTAKSYQEGLSRLESLAKNKLGETKGPVVIAICGLPNAGKSRLKKDFLNDLTRFEANHATARGVIGIEKVPSLISSGEMPSEFLIVESVGERAVIQREAEELGKSISLFVYIYNPKLHSGVSEESKRDADLLILNPDSKVK